jgi:hypothetical protein
MKRPVYTRVLTMSFFLSVNDERGLAGGRWLSIFNGGESAASQ